LIVKFLGFFIVVIYGSDSVFSETATGSSAIGSSSGTVFFSSSFFFLPFITFGALFNALATLVDDFFVLSDWSTTASFAFATTFFSSTFFSSTTFFSSGFLDGSLIPAGLTAAAGLVAAAFLSA
jgi:hypothetical protein